MESIWTFLLVAFLIGILLILLSYLLEYFDRKEKESSKKSINKRVEVVDELSKKENSGSTNTSPLKTPDWQILREATYTIETKNAFKDYELEQIAGSLKKISAKLHEDLSYFASEEEKKAFIQQIKYAISSYRSGRMIYLVWDAGKSDDLFTLRGVFFTKEEAQQYVNDIQYQSEISKPMPIDKVGEIMGKVLKDGSLFWQMLASKIYSEGLEYKEKMKPIRLQRDIEQKERKERSKTQSTFTLKELKQIRQELRNIDTQKLYAIHEPLKLKLAFSSLSETKNLYDNEITGLTMIEIQNLCKKYLKKLNSLDCLIIDGIYFTDDLQKYLTKFEDRLSAQELEQLREEIEVVIKKSELWKYPTSSFQKKKAESRLWVIEGIKKKKQHEQEVSEILPQVQRVFETYSERLVNIVYHGPKEADSYAEDWECEVFFYNVPEPPPNLQNPAKIECFYDDSRTDHPPMSISEATERVEFAFENDLLFWKKLMNRVYYHLRDIE